MILYMLVCYCIMVGIYSSSDSDIDMTFLFAPVTLPMMLGKLINKLYNGIK